jgi:UDP-glucuronate 4-epimerase
MAQAAERAVVLGGAGFIGSTLVDRLLAEGWQVTAVDCFEPFYSPDRKRRNLAGALAHPAFRLAEQDTRDRDGLLRTIVEASPVVIFDLAARAGVRPSITDPGLYIDINVRGLQHALEAAAAIGARYVFASSSSIYGNDERRPYREEQALGRPVSPYGATKVAGEALVHAHHALRGLPVGIARLFTVYGPRQRPDLAIYSFARRILGGEPLELFDGGRGRRDYTYVDDVIDALMRLAASGDGYLLVNVGGGAPMETVEVVGALERALQRRAEVRLLPPQPGDVVSTWADIALARERLGWSPQVAFSAGIERFCRWLIDEDAVESGPPASAGRP